MNNNRERSHSMPVLFLTALTVWQITGDGEASMFEGTSLIATFVILATVAAFEK